MSEIGRHCSIRPLLIDGCALLTTTPIPLFLNPAAGRGRAAAKKDAIVQIFKDEGVALSPVASTDVGDLERRVREHAGANGGPIIVAGGDGSLHEAANGILQAGSDSPLGLVPIGTGNDFAKACNISLEWETAARQLAKRIADNAPTRRIDAGRMNDRYFANGVGIGFDAKVNRIARKYRWPIGDLVYLFAVLEGLWDGVITPSVTLRFNDEEYVGRITLANISNGPWVGGMFYIAPMAENDDSALDLVVAYPVSRPRILALLPKLIRGTHIDQPEVACSPVESVEIIAEEPIPCHLDGEVQPLQQEFRIEILKGALVLV